MQVLTITRQYLWDEHCGFQGEVSESREFRAATARDLSAASAAKAALVARFARRVGKGKPAKKRRINK